MGRVPNRDADLTPSGERMRKARGTSVTKAKAGKPQRPEPSDDWGTAARLIWDSLTTSGGAAFYESSDYAVLWLLCEQIEHLYSQGGRRSPEFLRVIMTGLGSLLATEGDRRRLRIELERAPDDDDEWLDSILRNLDA